MEWSPGKRIGFRFLLVYIGLFNWPFPLGYLPGTDKLVEWLQKPWDHVIAFAARHAFGITRNLVEEGNGSGDRTQDWIQVFAMLVISSVAAAVWTALARRREYRREAAWLRVCLRYTLAFTMLSYGISKAFCLQFSEPPPWRLVESFGDASPMGLLWTFMGQSPAYTMFTGWAEILGGVLLFTRRTTMLGALLVTSVMVNVVMLNLCYDVPVKIYSTHLLFFAACLLAPDARRLFDLLVHNRATLPAPLGSFTSTVRGARIALAVKLALIVVVVGAQLDYSFERKHKEAPNALTGAYEVESFERDGENRPLLVTDGTLWRKVGISTRGRLMVRRMDDTETRWQLVIDDKKHFLTLEEWDDPKKKTVLSYDLPDPEHVRIHGVLHGERLSVRLRRLETSHFLLKKRGFHWVNDIPFNY